MPYYSLRQDTVDRACEIWEDSDDAAAVSLAKRIKRVKQSQWMRPETWRWVAAAACLVSIGMLLTSMVIESHPHNEPRSVSTFLLIMTLASMLMCFYAGTKHDTMAEPRDVIEDLVLGEITQPFPKPNDKEAPSVFEVEVYGEPIMFELVFPANPGTADVEAGEYAQVA